jgi:hypothetical protein
MRKLLLIVVAMFAMALAAPAAQAHTVDGVYRDDVTAGNCEQYGACEGGSTSSSSSDTSSSSSGESSSGGTESSGSSGSMGSSTNSNVDVSCEASHAQDVDPSGNYWGKYQWDRQTWSAYGEGEWGSASEEAQDAAAAKVPYDAWPNC